VARPFDRATMSIDAGQSHGSFSAIVSGIQHCHRDPDTSAPMPPASLLAATLMGFLTVYAAVGISVAVYRNLHHGLTYRLALRSQLGGLRLSDLLGRLEIGQDRYLHHSNVTEINRQMRRCDTCQHHVVCDRALDSASWRDVAAFCPNFPELAELPAHISRT
jgi:hypothetical protein